MPPSPSIVTEFVALCARLLLPVRQELFCVLGDGCEGAAHLRTLAPAGKDRRFVLTSCESAQSSFPGSFESSVRLLCETQATSQVVVAVPNADAMVSAAHIPRSPTAWVAGSFGMTARRIAPAGNQMREPMAFWQLMHKTLNPICGEGAILLSKEWVDIVFHDYSSARKVWAIRPMSDGAWFAVFCSVNAKDGGPHRQAAMIALPDSPAFRFENAPSNVTRQQALLTRPSFHQRAQAAIDEGARIVSGAPVSNLTILGGTLRFALTPFQQYTGSVDPTLTAAGALISGKNVYDVITLPATREALRSLLNAPVGSVFTQPAVREAVTEAERLFQAGATPLVAPLLAQRIAWMDEAPTAKAARDWEQFHRGRSYPITSTIVEGTREETRHRPGYGPEVVRTTGQEVLMVLNAQTDPTQMAVSYGFTQHPLPKKAQALIAGRFLGIRFFLLQDLLSNFEMPDVPDVTESEGDTYMQMLDRLGALETAIP